MRRGFVAWVLFAGLRCALGADDGLARCAGIEEVNRRLACYDELARRPSSADLPAEPEASYLARAWKLGPADAAPRRLVDILSYRPDYALMRWTDRPNARPRSPATGRSSLEDIDHVEAKIQASFKTELASREAFSRSGVTPSLNALGIDSVRLWFAYTQKMHWQVFNHGESRPIRDTNYEPELILTLGTANRGNGFKLVNLGLSHESNGIDPSQHRGWSRMYAQGGWEWDRLSVLARVWRIVPQSDDDNPNIANFMGYGDIALRYQGGSHVTTLLVRDNAATGRRFVEIDSASGLLGSLGGFKLHFQFTYGYGETLIDYNHRQTTLGIGVSFGDW